MSAKIHWVVGVLVAETACGKPRADLDAVVDRTRVTCKSCLKVIAKGR